MPQELPAQGKKTSPGSTTPFPGLQARQWDTAVMKQIESGLIELACEVA